MLFSRQNPYGNLHCQEETRKSHFHNSLQLMLNRAYACRARSGGPYRSPFSSMTNLPQSARTHTLFGDGSHYLRRLSEPPS